MKCYPLVLILLMCCPVFALAQHDHMHNMENMKDMPQGKTDNVDTLMRVGMTHSYSLSLPMSRNGSGTGWLPDASPMHMFMKKASGWDMMFHVSIFLRQNFQDLGKAGSRGGKQFDAPDYFMMMAQHKVGGRGLFNFNLMMSLDNLTMGGFGYPLLFQSGESWQGKPLVDRQHPHDLFSELSMAYTYKVADDLDLTGYLGYPGEPALGPVVFMHRLSALSNPDATLGHHWQDATHITFGVATIGMRYHKFKFEASSFTGREPDENRYDFDRPRFDSYSCRILFNPSENWALQVSRGLIKSPEEVRPAENIVRNTASVIHAVNLGEGRYWTSTIACGLNEGTHAESSVLLESHLQIKRTAIYGRYEWVQKDTAELSIVSLSKEILNVNALTVGLSYHLLEGKAGIIALGSQATIFKPDNAVKAIYGTHPYSMEVYLHFLPPLMNHKRSTSGHAM